MNLPLSSSLLCVGKVVRPHGLNGLLRVLYYAGSEAPFPNVRTVIFKLVSGEMSEATVLSVRPHKKVFLMALDGLTSIDEAEKYRSAEIFVDKNALNSVENFHFWHDLIGLRVFLDTGEYLGDLTRIIPTPGNDIYVVKKGAKEFLIPAVHEVIMEIDLHTQSMVISPIEGLLDLNEV